MIKFKIHKSRKIGNLAKTNSSILSFSSFFSTHRAEPGNADGGVVDSTATEITNVVIDNLGGTGSYSNVVSMAAGEQNCPDTAAACVQEVGFGLGLVTETTSAIRPGRFSAKSEKCDPIDQSVVRCFVVAYVPLTADMLVLLLISTGYSMPYLAFPR